MLRNPGLGVRDILCGPVLAPHRESFLRVLQEHSGPVCVRVRSDEQARVRVLGVRWLDVVDPARVAGPMRFGGWVRTYTS